jgi:glycosyltransferase involved in cell wall biosynthesis/peptidoglycan/xylan/chitin deacetylase (PgdA/CDA1 family)
MRVLYFIDSIAPGGAGRSLLAVAPHLASKGVQLEVAYLVEREPNLRAGLERAGARVRAVGGSSRLAWIARATRLIQDRRPDLVHTTLFEADVAGRVAGFIGGIPVVSSLVNLAYGPEQLRDRHLARWKVAGARMVDAATARIPVRFHAVTREVGEVMARRLRIPSERMEVVPRGRDLAALGLRTPERRSEVRESLGLGTNERAILAVGRQEYQKGFDVLLEAFGGILDDIPHARLYLCGRRGGATDDLEQKARPIRSHVSFLGHRDDVPDLICAADLVVLPSRWEGIGGVLLEAMALQAPIVASDLPALREVLAEGLCGVLVPLEHPQALRRAMVETLEGGQQTIARVDAGRRRFEQTYRADRVADQMLAFYERALTRPEAGRSHAKPIGRRSERSIKPLPKAVAQRVDRLLVRSPAQAAFLRRSQRRLAILAYHAITDPEPFARQLDYLGQEAHPVSLEEALAALEGRASLPKHAVLITFDDADRSLLENGLGSLRERGLPGAAFVIAGHLNGHQPFWWVEADELVQAGGRVADLGNLSAPEVVRRLKRLSEDRRRAAMDELRLSSRQMVRTQAQLHAGDLRTLTAAGVAIGNHTVNHPCLPRCTGDQVRGEIVRAHEILAQAAGSPPEVFAYPNGDWDPRAEPVLEGLGYRAGFLFDHAIMKPSASRPFRVSRLRVDSTTSTSRLALLLSGLHPAIHRVRTRMLNGGTRVN